MFSICEKHPLLSGEWGLKWKPSAVRVGPQKNVSYHRLAGKNCGRNGLGAEPWDNSHGQSREQVWLQSQTGQEQNSKKCMHKSHSIWRPHRLVGENNAVGKLCFNVFIKE